MKNKYSSNSNGVPEYEVKESQNIKYILSKFDYELFDEAKDIVSKVIRIKAAKLPNKNNGWKILEDGEIVFLLDSKKLSKKENKFLHTADGIGFLMVQARIGIKSLHKLRQALKTKLKQLKQKDKGKL